MTTDTINGLYKWHNAVCIYIKDSIAAGLISYLHRHTDIVFTCVDLVSASDANNSSVYTLTIPGTHLRIIMYGNFLYHYMKQGIVKVNNLFINEELEVINVIRDEEKIDKATEIIMEYQQRQRIKAELLGVQHNPDKFRIRLDGSVVLISVGQETGTYYIPPFVDVCGQMVYKMYGGREFVSCFAECRGDFCVVNESNHLQSMFSMFADCIFINRLDLRNFSVTGTTEMHSMFARNTGLRQLLLGDWDTSACEDMTYMFACCNLLPELPIDKWDVSNVRSMRGMFMSCRNLERLDLSTWNTVTVRNICDMFSFTTKLTEAGINAWPIDSIVCADCAFVEAKLLKPNVAEFITRLREQNGVGI